jgi:hypothetical protein
MPRFRVRDLMISIGPGGDDGFPCELITECGGVTELCVENTQGCAFTVNCNCTIQSVCDPFTCRCSVCTPCSAQTCGCTCTQCTGVTGGCLHTFCTARSACGASLQCTPTFAGAFGARLRPEHLAQLKEELRATLERVEAEEQRLAERMQPQTVDEVNQLEQKLTEALEELRRRREELERRGQGGA